MTLDQQYRDHAEELKIADWATARNRRVIRCVDQIIGFSPAKTGPERTNCRNFLYRALDGYMSQYSLELDQMEQLISINPRGMHDILASFSPSRPRHK